MERTPATIAKTRQWETMAVFALLFMFLGVKFQRQLFIFLAMAFLCSALFIPSLTRIITLGWLKLSLLLSKVNNRIILTIIFFLVLTPIAFLYRLFNKDPLGLSPKESDSYYYDRNHTYAKTDLEKLW